MPFDNPYTFVPPLDPPQGASYNPAKPAENMLHQGPPAGHDRYHNGLWRGRIGIEIETVTPLLVPEAKPVTDVAGHKTFKSRRSGTIKIGTSNEPLPLLPVTSFKGPLRAAYEAVTNSRFGVFEKHDRPLARRMAATEGLSLVPGRIVKDGAGFKVELWTGTTAGYPDKISVNGRLRWHVPNNLNYAAWLPSYNKGQPTAVRRMQYVGPTGGDPCHGDEVHCWVEQWEKTGRFKYWKVREIAKNPASLSPIMGIVASVVAAGAPHQPIAGSGSIKQVRGWVVASNQTTENKHDERVFFVDTAAQPVAVPIPPVEQKRLQEKWKNLISNYKVTNMDDIKERTKTGTHTNYIAATAPLTPNDIPALSRHTYDGFDAEINPGEPFDPKNAHHTKVGTLCFVRLKMNGNAPLSVPIQVAGAWVHLPVTEDIFPVMISREIGNWAPAELLNEALAPAKTIQELSPADRVFGWVRDGEGDGPAAWKGQLRIAPIEYKDCKDENGKEVAPIQTIANGPLPLAIQSTPKPSQARFYAAGDKLGTPMRGDISRAGYFGPRDYANPASRPATGLRGRKFYPHHASASAPAVSASYWNPVTAISDAQSLYPPQPGQGEGALYREYVRRPETPNIFRRDKQNRSIEDWIRPKTRFTTHIDVVNVNTSELGALLWLLDLPHFLADDDGNGGPAVDGPVFHRVGGGRPLGFGSVKVTLSSLELKDGNAIKDRYGSLLAIYGQPDNSTSVAPALATNLVATFQAANSFVGGFRRCLMTTYPPEGTFEDIPFIAAFLAAARGNAGNPVHYPRLRPVPGAAGENFKWFQSNNNQGRQNALPSATDGRGLPYYPDD